MTADAPDARTPAGRRTDWLTVQQVAAELGVSRAAFYRWRQQGAGPPTVRLPGGQVRIRRGDLEEWLRRREDDEQGP